MPALFKGARILIVEDNPINQEVVREIVERAGLVAELAANGRRAVEAVAGGGRYDAVLMDLQMPEMDGYEATRRIRERKNVGELPVIALSAGTGAEERERCLAAGMNDYLTKPVDPRELYAALQRCLSLPDQEPAEIQATDTPGGHDEEPPFAQELPGIDIPEGLQRCGNRRLFREIIVCFRERNLTALADLAGAIASGDRERLKARVHALKGLAGNIAAVQVYALSQALEAAIDENRPAADLSLLVDLLVPQMQQVFAAAEKLEALAAGPAPARAGAAGGIAELRPRFLELRRLLHVRSLEAIDVLSELSPALPALPELEILKKQVARLDFSDASGTLERLAAACRIGLQGEGP